MARSTLTLKLGGSRKWSAVEAVRFAAVLSRRLGRPVTVEELFGPEAAA